MTDAVTETVTARGRTRQVPLVAVVSGDQLSMMLSGGHFLLSFYLLAGSQLRMPEAGAGGEAPAGRIT